MAKKKKKKTKVKVLSFAAICGKIAPAFTTAPQAASIMEVADRDAAENNSTHASTQILRFSDTDVDVHTVAFAPAAGGYLGTFTLGAVNQKTDSFSWTFAVHDSAIDYLQAGETLVQTYNVTVRDAAGRTATTTVTITITGTNDAPEITSGVQGGTVMEIADGAPGENAVTHSQTGTITFSDVDTLDTHSASVAALGNNYVGTLVLGAVDQGADSVGWTFSVPDSVIDSLRPNETRTQLYTVTIDDGHGGTATQTITIVIHGADDGVVIFGLDVAGGELTVDEDDLSASRGPGESDGSSPDPASLTKTGTFTISAPDGVASITVAGTLVPLAGPFPVSIATPLGNAIAILGFNTATGVVSYAYTLLDNEFHPFGAGENSLTESIEVRVVDTDGSTATDFLDVTIVDDIISVGFVGPHSVHEIGAPITGNYNVTAGADGLSAGTLTVDVNGAGLQTFIASELLDGETIVTSAGTLTFSAPNAAFSGTWTFAPSAVATTVFVTFGVILFDSDADFHFAAHHIAVINDTPPVVNDDIVITNVAAFGPASLEIPDYALLANDTDVDGQPIAVTGVSGGAGGTASHAASTVTFTGLTSAGGSFTYTGTAGGASDTATVTITHVAFAAPLDGNGAANIIISGVGSDTINGFGGNDVLIGGSGSDTFVFDSALNGTTNVDTILDFDATLLGGQDVVMLDSSIFTALSSGALSAAAFTANTTGDATAASQHIIFETDTGALFYDADGVGAGAKVQFATLTLGGIVGGVAAVDATDFFIV